MADPMTTRIDGEAPEPVIVRDMLKRAAWIAPALVIVGTAFWGLPGAVSTAYAVALVCVNFVLAASLNSWAARISVAALGAAAMFGFLLRLGLIFLAVLLVRDAWWVSLVPLGLTLVVTHLGLLFWEMKYISASLAFPALKPKPVESQSKESAQQ
jgi:hypothetical protein